MRKRGWGGARDTAPPVPAEHDGGGLSAKKAQALARRDGISEQVGFLLADASCTPTAGTLVWDELGDHAMKLIVFQAVGDFEFLIRRKK